MSEEGELTFKFTKGNHGQCKIPNHCLIEERDLGIIVNLKFIHKLSQNKNDA